jgi:hypothetical protein
VLSAALTAAALVAGPPASPAWVPDLRAARAYAEGRRGVVAFSVREGEREWTFRGERTMQAASVLKAMLMVAYLNRPPMRRRALARADRALLAPMIRRSDNETATRIRDLVGNAGLRRLARRAGMARFDTARIWGQARITASDQTRFFLRLEEWIVPRHRRAALDLTAAIVPSQRWGVALVAPHGWRLHFKGGWGSGTGAVDHQVALLRRRDGRRVAVAVLTERQGSHAYGKETLRGVAARLLRGL